MNSRKQRTTTHPTPRIFMVNRLVNPSYTQNKKKTLSASHIYRAEVAWKNPFRCGKVAWENPEKKKKTIPAHIDRQEWLKVPIHRPFRGVFFAI